MGNLGFQELLLIGIVILVLFGGRKIPEFMKGLGKGIREFNDAKNNVRKEIEEGLNENPAPPPPPAAKTANPVSAVTDTTAVNTNTNGTEQP